MSVLPIENAAFYPKSQEVSMQRHTEIQKPVNEQVVLQSDKVKQDMINGEKTMQLEHTENPEYRYDGGGGGKGMLYDRQQKQKKKKEKVIEGHSEMTGFDIRI